MGMTPGGGMFVVGVIVMPITVVRMVVGVRLVGMTMIVMAVSVIVAVTVAVMMRRRCHHPTKTAMGASQQANG
jgi:hypothetical protein